MLSATCINRIAKKTDVRQKDVLVMVRIAD